MKCNKKGCNQEATYCFINPGETRRQMYVCNVHVEETELFLRALNKNIIKEVI